MSKVNEFLSETGVFFMATVDGNQPKLRPLGAHMEVDGKIIFGVGDFKNVYKQMVANPLLFYPFHFFFINYQQSLVLHSAEFTGKRAAVYAEVFGEGSLGEGDFYKAVLILGQGSEINKYPVTQTFLAEYSDLLIKDKVFARKAFYQVLGEDRPQRRSNLRLINRAQVYEQHNTILNSSDLHGAVFCTVDYEYFTKQITAAESVHCDLIKVFVLKGAFNFSLQ